MAQIVSVVASTHNPRIFWNRDDATPEDMDKLYATFAQVRDAVAATHPDALVVLGNDHLDNFFFDKLPSFTIGTGPEINGPFWYESEIMHLPFYKAPIHQNGAQYLLRSGLENGITFAQSQELHVDHAFTVPLSFLRPQADLPVIPIMTNAFGAPLAENRTWYNVGSFLKDAIGAWQGVSRVAVIASFNLTIEVGGPLMGKVDVPYSRWMLELMGAGKRDEILEKLTVRELITHGNSTIEFLNYVSALGIVGDRVPTFIKHDPIKGVGTCPLAYWTM